MSLQEMPVGESKFMSVHTEAEAKRYGASMRCLCFGHKMEQGGSMMMKTALSKQSGRYMLALFVCAMLTLVMFSASKLATSAEDSQAELEKAIEKGKSLYSDTNLGKSGRSCDTCHPGGGTTGGEVMGMAVPSLMGKASTFPKYKPQAAGVITLAQMNNICIEMALEGEALKLGSDEAVALEAYVASLNNKALVRSYIEEVYNKGNTAAIDEFLAADFVHHNLPPGMGSDLESYRRFTSSHHAAFPDFHITIEDMVAEEDTVAVRFTWGGTHKGEFIGIPPTGKQVAVKAICIHRIEGGKVAESWSRVDEMGMMQQLGAIPPPSQAGQ